MLQPVKDPSESISVDFDFADISSSTPSAASCTGTIYQGTDATPLVFGAASISGTVVTFAITGGTDGGIYTLKCSATIGGVTKVKSKVLVVRSKTGD